MTTHTRTNTSKPKIVKNAFDSFRRDARPRLEHRRNAPSFDRTRIGGGSWTSSRRVLDLWNVLQLN